MVSTSAYLFIKSISLILNANGQVPPLFFYLSALSVAATARKYTNTSLWPHARQTHDNQLPPNFLPPLILNQCILSEQARTLYICHHTVLICLPWMFCLPNSFYLHPVPLFIQWVSSIHFSCPNHLSWPLLITRLTGSNPNNFLSSAFFFLSQQTHIS